MRIPSKRLLTLGLILCICLSLLRFSPVKANADNELKKAIVTVEYGDPVVMMDVSANAVRASGSGYKLVSASWINSEGKTETGSFKKGSYRLEIVLAADKGNVFASNAVGYINNSNNGVTTTCSGDGSRLTLTKNYSATIWTPVTIKHPGPETVKEGGWCSFVVSGMYIGSYEWVLESPDGKTVPASKLSETFPTLRQEGDGTGKIKFYDIPYEMNGWKIYCTLWSVDHLNFTNTKSTTLTVTTDRPQPTPEPSAAPTETPAPEASAAPADAAGTDQAEAGTDQADAGSEPADGESSPAEEEEHHFSESWSYDQQTHWHACEDEGCDELQDQAPHSMTWTESRAASRTEPGEEKGVCSVCGYKTVRELPFDEEAAASEQNIFLIILFGLLAILLLSIVILIIQAIRRAARRR